MRKSTQTIYENRHRVEEMMKREAENREEFRNNLHKKENVVMKIAKRQAKKDVQRGMRTHSAKVAKLMREKIELHEINPEEVHADEEQDETPHLSIFLQRQKLVEQIDEVLAHSAPTLPWECLNVQESYETLSKEYSDYMSDSSSTEINNIQLKKHRKERKNTGKRKKNEERSQGWRRTRETR